MTAPVQGAKGGKDMSSVELTEPSTRDSAVAVIKDEHRTLASVVHALQDIVREIGMQYTETDFQLIACMLYYIDAYPERCHHPKEDEFLFRLLRMRTSSAEALLDSLQAQHLSGAQMIAHLQQLFVHYLGGAPNGHRQFAEAVESYAAFLATHVELEESGVLPLADRYLQPDDWAEICTAFRVNKDPIGDAHSQREFHKLKLRIVNLLPRKLKTHGEH